MTNEAIGVLAAFALVVMFNCHHDAVTRAR